MTHDPGTAENGSDADQRLVLITGPSGAGRSTAINALEDLGFETIDNLPLSLLPRLLDGPPLLRPLALGIDVRNREFSVAGLLDLLEHLHRRPGLQVELVYLDAREDVLIRRFSETRRRHPLAPAESPGAGIAREFALLADIRARADVLIDTSDLTPHDLRAEMEKAHGALAGPGLALSLQSFSYKRGVPRGADMVLDCRFLQNPHWQAALRPLTGRDAAVAAHVAADPGFDGFIDKTLDLVEFLLPAYQQEGKSHFTVAFGCTGGRHRSVAVAECLARGLAQAGWRVSIRHRELDRENAPTSGVARPGPRQAE